uniref:Dynactin subunit 6 n=1 Tax=Caenorhabditis tropicalis TaxID=1561998 RepID=A0A1I7UVI2_9PELO
MGELVIGESVIGASVIGSSVIGSSMIGSSVTGLIVEEITELPVDKVAKHPLTDFSKEKNKITGKDEIRKFISLPRRKHFDIKDVV